MLMLDEINFIRNSRAIILRSPYQESMKVFYPHPCMGAADGHFTTMVTRWMPGSVMCGHASNIIDFSDRVVITVARRTKKFRKFLHFKVAPPRGIEPLFPG